MPPRLNNYKLDMKMFEFESGSGEDVQARYVSLKVGQARNGSEICNPARISGDWITLDCALPESGVGNQYFARQCQTTFTYPALKAVSKRCKRKRIRAAGDV